MKQKENGKLVSFRLAAEIYDDLKTRAEEHGESPGTYARELLLKNLGSAGQEEILRELEILRNQVFKAREDVASLAVVLLVACGKKQAAEAQQWVAENLSQ